MCRIILTAILLSVATPVVAQSNGPVPGAPDTKPTVSAANHPQANFAAKKAPTAVEKEAERIRRFLQTTNPADAQGGSTLIAPNGIKPIQLYQTPNQPVALSPPSSTITHTVVKGDTLYGLAKRYNVTIADLQRANGIPGNAIRLGQAVKIPALATQTSVSTKTASVAQPTSKGLKTRKIVEPVPDDSITQMAADPSLPTVQIYAVLPKDTLSSIARRACVDVTDLVSANTLAHADALTPGQQLKLPDGHCLTR